MNPIGVTYIAIIVAILIISWGGFELTSRARRKKTTRSSRPDTWVPLKPHPADLLEDPTLDTDDPGILDQQTRVRQNGHYSQQKKNM